MSLRSTDFLIIGGGIIGINLAIVAKQRHPDCSVTLIEKESDCGIHASGRNSGVLHAGFYYTADSLKARFTLDGNRKLTEYCEERNLLINKCGKLVVTKDESELDTLDELYIRGQKNGVNLDIVSAKEAKEIEPRIKTIDKALYSPTTSSVDPRQVVAAILQDAIDLGIQVLPCTQYLNSCDDGVQTSKGKLITKYVINAAGLYADKIARDYGFSNDFRIVPFKGLYLISNEVDHKIRTNIYPVPDLRNPFLGVHFTITAHGKVEIGPTAIPAFWREHYEGFENFNFSEMIEIISFELALFIRNDFGFRKLAFEELAKYQKSYMAKLASKLATNVKATHFEQRGPAGIRAQLFNIRERKLEMDFHFEGDDRSFHVLNAVSPAFTCSIPFTQYLFEKIDKLMQ